MFSLFLCRQNALIKYLYKNSCVQIQKACAPYIVRLRVVRRERVKRNVNRGLKCYFSL